MGWWSEDVFGGDTPWDFLGDIAEAIDFKHDDMHSLVHFETWEPEVKHDIAKKLEKNWDAVVKIGVHMNDFEVDVYWQVLGQLCIAVGAIFPQPIRYQMIKSCLKDEWALEGEQVRQNEMARLAHDITFYKDGVPQPRTIKGHDSFNKFIQAFIQECR